MRNPILGILGNTCSTSSSTLRRLRSLSRGTRTLRIILGVVAHERRQLDRALTAPFREPVFGYFLGEFLVGDGGPERGPGARDDAPDVVASAARCDPAASAEVVGQVVYPMGHVLVEAGRCGEVCQGSRAWPSQPFWERIRSGPKARRAWGTTASKQETQDSSPVGARAER